MNSYRKKNPASIQNVFCYTSDELKAYRNGEIAAEKRAEIAAHLNIEKCFRCRQIYQLISNSASAKNGGDENKRDTFASKSRILEKLKSDMGKHSSPPVPFDVKTGVRKGQIWTTSPKPRNMQGQQVSHVDAGMPVLIVDDGTSKKQLSNLIRVIPLSFDIEYHFPGETILFDKAGPLMTGFILEIFNESPMLAGNLSEFRGTLSPSDMETVQNAKKQFIYLNSGNALENSADSQYEDYEYREWKKRELQLANYLAFPVNESLWELAVEIELSSFKKAADSGDRGIPEKKSVLIDNDDCSLTVFQNKDQLFARFESGTVKPGKVKVDGNLTDMISSGPNEYDVILGNTAEMAEYVQLEIELGEEALTFPLKVDTCDRKRDE